MLPVTSLGLNHKVSELAEIDRRRKLMETRIESIKAEFGAEERGAATLSADGTILIKVGGAMICVSVARPGS